MCAHGCAYVARPRPPAVKVDLDGTNDSHFFSYIVGVLSVIPIVMPIFIRFWMRLHHAGLDARMAVKDAAWE